MIRWAANDVFKSLKDQVRVVRYSIKAEAEAPGSTLPKVFHDLKPVLAMGGPALRLADGIFSEVETLADNLAYQSAESGYPSPLQTYLDRDAGLSSSLYAPFKAILTESGVKAMLISERALDEAGERFRDRQADLIPRNRAMTIGEVAQASAALIRALADARPIWKVTFGDAGSSRPNLMLSPNLYCAIVVGIASGLVTLKPELVEDRQAVLDSAGSVADVRLHRFSRALSGKTPDAEMARELELLLPFLP